MVELIDSREIIRLEFNECLLCCEEKECIVCNKCNNKACKSCVEHYIISSDSSECFHCEYHYNDEILNIIFEKEYIEKNIRNKKTEEKEEMEEEEEKEEEKEEIIKVKVDNPKLVKFKTQKLFDIEKLHFAETLKYVELKQKVETMLLEYEEFIGYRYEFISSFYYDMIDNDCKFAKCNEISTKSG